MDLETKPDIDDFVVVIRIKTTTFGIPNVRTNEEAFKIAQGIAEQAKRHCDGVHDAFVAVESDGCLPSVGEWNKDFWK
jgi:hypothetical protein